MQFASCRFSCHVSIVTHLEADTLLHQNRPYLRVLANHVTGADDDALAFGKGISGEDEPDLWHKDLTGAIEVLEESPMPATANRAEIEQVISNLILNAAQAMPRGGTIRVRAFQGNGDRRAGGRHFDPPCTLPHGHVQACLEPKALVEGERRILVGDRDADCVQAGDACSIGHGRSFRSSITCSRS